MKNPFECIKNNYFCWKQPRQFVSFALEKADKIYKHLHCCIFSHLSHRTPLRLAQPRQANDRMPTDFFGDRPAINSLLSLLLVFLSFVVFSLLFKRLTKNLIIFHSLGICDNFVFPGSSRPLRVWNICAKTNLWSSCGQWRAIISNATQPTACCYGQGLKCKKTRETTLCDGDSPKSMYQLYSIYLQRFLTLEWCKCCSSGLIWFWTGSIFLKPVQFVLRWYKLS